MGTDKLGNDLDTLEVFTVREGFFVMWVCAPKELTREQVQVGVDRLPPAGTSNGWQVQEEYDEDPQHTSPGLCAESPTRQHWKCLC